MSAARHSTRSHERPVYGSQAGARYSTFWKGLKPRDLVGVRALDSEPMSNVAAPTGRTQNK